jgi:formylglycine-generating enzyme required for sulfatase activity
MRVFCEWFSVMTGEKFTLPTEAQWEWALPRLRFLPAADAGQNPAGVLAQAAQAAKSGAESTKDIAARFGRARNVGAKSIGTPDTGATSVALVFQGLAEAVK